ncbi:MAG: sel1 repeat family protein [Roseburia sp.]|nr:sel1 repeat family protein [Anaeroplasma bactoclasticum]MCM1196397.1 sel1 repeat family protein [Roseburia sp.]MCM1556325.1 sel1 repeat family protein [Anaeroplasma bactoclasticum]
MVMNHEYYIRGKKLLESGDLENAYQIFQSNQVDVLCLYGSYILLSMGFLKDSNIEELFFSRFNEIEGLVEKDDIEAIFVLGVCYERGIKYPMDFNRAEKLYLKAYEMGHHRAGFNLATLYQNSPNINDVEKALRIYEVLAKENNSEAMVNAGYIFLFCKNIQNIYLAIKYFQSAVKFNDSLAEYYLGLIYLNKDFGYENVDLALEYLNKSISKGNLDAKELLADYYFSNELEKTKSFVMYKELVEAKYLPAYFRLGVCYELGIGGIKNIELAREYYSLASENGDKRAILRLLNIGN